MAAGEISREKRINLGSNVRPMNVEATDMNKPNDAVFVDEHAVWHDVEVEQTPKLSRTIDDCRKREFGREWTHALTIDVDRNAQEREARRRGARAREIAATRAAGHGIFTSWPT